MIAVGAVLIVACGVTSTFLNGTLGVITVSGMLVQFTVAGLLIRDARPKVSLKTTFAVIWVLSFTLRLLQITVAPDFRYNHPAVYGASDAAKAGMWVLTTAGFVAFWLGTRGGRFVRPKSLSEVSLPRHTVIWLSYVFLALSYAVAFSGINVGFLQNFGQFYLFIIAYASYESAREGRSVGPELGVVFLSTMLAIVFGVKEFAVFPVLAWVLGQWAGGRRMLTVGGFVVLSIGACFYVGVQSQRTAAVLNENTRFIPAFEKGITQYDLIVGAYREKKGFDIVYNPAASVVARLAGVDSLLVIQARTPKVIPYQHGRSLWQPALSTLPGASVLASPEFRSLSLGRYFSSKFWSLRPDYDVSSQPLTVPGDFYLNFGSVGLVLGMVAFGLLYSALDRRIPVTNATAAGLFAYAAFPLLAFERNVAYLLVTAGIRYAVGLAMLRLLVSWGLGKPEGQGGDPGGKPRPVALVGI